MLRTSFERVLKTSGTEGYYRFRIPGMLKTERGFLFAMEARCENKGDWGIAVVGHNVTVSGDKSVEPKQIIGENI